MSYLGDIVRDHGGNATLYISDEGSCMDISQFADRYEEGVQLLTQAQTASPTKFWR